MAITYRKMIFKDDWEDVLKVVDIKKEDMNKLVLSFLAIECYEEAAEIFINESGTQLSETELEGMRARANIKRMILRGELLGAIKSIRSYKPLAFKCGKMKSQLAQQIMIELIGDGEVEKAVEFGQEMFLEYVASHEDIEKTCCLLAFEDLSKCPHAELLSTSQRLKTANVVNQAILTSEGQEEPNLYNMLRELLLVKNQINEMAAYPQMNISSGILEDPVI